MQLNQPDHDPIRRAGSLRLNVEPAIHILKQRGTCYAAKLAETMLFPAVQVAKEKLGNMTEGILGVCFVYIVFIRTV